MSDHAATLDAVIALALRLSRAERARLIERVAATLAEETKAEAPPRRNAYGALSDLGLDVSGEDIDEARQAMLANFPREDIA